MSFFAQVNSVPRSLQGNLQGAATRCTLSRSSEAGPEPEKLCYGNVSPHRVASHACDSSSYEDPGVSDTRFLPVTHSFTRLPYDQELAMPLNIHSDPSSLDRRNFFSHSDNLKQNDDTTDTNFCSFQVPQTPSIHIPDRVVEFGRQQSGAEFWSNQTASRTGSCEAPSSNSTMCLDTAKTEMAKRHVSWSAHVRAQKNTCNYTDKRKRSNLRSLVSTAEDYEKSDTPDSTVCITEARLWSRQSSNTAIMRTDENDKAIDIRSPSSLIAFMPFRRSQSLAPSSHSPPPLVPMHVNPCAGSGDAARAPAGSFLSENSYDDRAISAREGGDNGGVRGGIERPVMLDDILVQEEQWQDTHVVIDSPDFHRTPQDLEHIAREGSCACSPSPINPLAPAPLADEQSRITSSPTVAAVSCTSTRFTGNSHSISCFIGLPVTSTFAAPHNTTARPPTIFSEARFSPKLLTLPYETPPEDPGRRLGGDMQRMTGAQPAQASPRPTALNEGNSIVKREQSPSRRSSRISPMWYGDPPTQHGMDTTVRLPSATLLTSMSYLSLNQNSEGLTDMSLCLSASPVSTPAMTAQSVPSIITLGPVEAPARPLKVMSLRDKKRPSSYWHSCHRQSGSCDAYSRKASFLIRSPTSFCSMPGSDEIADSSSYETSAHFRAFSTPTAALNRRASYSCPGRNTASNMKPQGRYFNKSSQSYAHLCASCCTEVAPMSTIGGRFGLFAPRLKPRHPGQSHPTLPTQARNIEAQDMDLLTPAKIPKIIPNTATLLGYSSVVTRERSPSIPHVSHTEPPSPEGRF